VLSAEARFPAAAANRRAAWAWRPVGWPKLAKVLVELVLYQRWRPAVLLEAGGMPSSTLALVTGAAAGTGWQLGPLNDDPLFALACAVAFRGECTDGNPCALSAAGCRPNGSTALPAAALQGRPA